MKPIDTISEQSARAMGKALKRCLSFGSAELAEACLGEAFGHLFRALELAYELGRQHGRKEGIRDGNDLQCSGHTYNQGRLEELEALFQQTHGCHWSWVAAVGDLSQALTIANAEIARLRLRGESIRHEPQR